MHGAASTGNAESRRIPGKRANTDVSTSTGNVNVKNPRACRTARKTLRRQTGIDVTHRRTRGGRSVQRQEPVRLAPQLSCPAMAATPGSSRQVTDGDATESVRPWESQYEREPDLPELRCSAAIDLFKHVEEMINARKPGVSTTRTLYNPESANRHTPDLSRVFDRAVQELPDRSGMRLHAVRVEENTVFLCRAIVHKTIEDIGGLIEAVKKGREAAVSSGPKKSIRSYPGRLEEVAGKIRQFFRKLDENDNIWVPQTDALPLCQAIVEKAPGLVNDCFGYHGLVTGIIDSVYMLALNGVLAGLTQYSCDTWITGHCYSLMEVSQRLNSRFSENEMNLLFSNWTMLRAICPELADFYCISDRGRTSNDTTDADNVSGFFSKVHAVDDLLAAKLELLSMRTAMKLVVESDDESDDEDNEAINSFFDDLASALGPVGRTVCHYAASIRRQQGRMDR